MNSGGCHPVRIGSISEMGMQINTGADAIVGVLSAYVPRELLFALGCAPLRVFPNANKPAAAEAYLPRNFCALTRLILADFLENGSSGLDAVVFSDEDDALRRLYDVWRTSASVPIWEFVEVPRTATPLAIERYADSLRRMGEDLATRVQIPLQTSALRDAIRTYNKQRSLLTQLKNRWLAGQQSTPVYRRLRRMALTQDPITANARLEQMLGQTGRAELESLDQLPTRRLLLLAELAAPASLVRLIEGHGARVVAEDSDLDERDLAEKVPDDANTLDDILTALARAYLTKAPGPRMRDLRRRLTYLTRLVNEREVDAAICAYGKFCDLFLAEFPRVKAHLRELGIPVLLLELEDDAIGGQHRTRVEAFLEMVNEGLQ
jgi:benzoyl-CoA reductase/2-hydroxyglutaryl-CoA dehydratase subunit BcrC/BadD/HgdB